MKGYWVIGRPYHKKDEVIHRFDSLKEARFFKGQIASGRILDWGDGVKLTKEERDK